jgi:hypothetical protein
MNLNPRILSPLLLLMTFNLAFAGKIEKNKRAPSSACAMPVERREWKPDGKIPTTDEINEWASTQCQALMVDLEKNCDLGVPADNLGRNCSQKVELDWADGPVPLKAPPAFDVVETLWGHGKNPAEAKTDLNTEVVSKTQELVKRVLDFTASCESLGGVAKVADVESQTPADAQLASGTKVFQISGTISASAKCLKKAKAPVVRGEFVVRFYK